MERNRLHGPIVKTRSDSSGFPAGTGDSCRQPRLDARLLRGCYRLRPPLIRGKAAMSTSSVATDELHIRRQTYWHGNGVHVPLYRGSADLGSSVAFSRHRSRTRKTATKLFVCFRQHFRTKKFRIFSLNFFARGGSTHTLNSRTDTDVLMY